MKNKGFALIVPMANEAETFQVFINRLSKQLSQLGEGTVYLVVDLVSVDQTLNLCRQLSAVDPRFVTVYAPENQNVVDAYLAGYRAAFEQQHPILIEMDAGLSHQPEQLGEFVSLLKTSHSCVFGSRFVLGGSMQNSPLKRRLLSKIGTLLSNLLLGTRLKDMTSGYQGFRAEVMQTLLHYPLRSKAHFYQTEVRYLLRYHNQIEIPIHYSSPSSRISWRAMFNALSVLSYYVYKRLTFSSIQL